MKKSVLAIMLGALCIIPVSYTHLDVYKRHIFRLLIRMGTHLSRIRS